MSRKYSNSVICLLIRSSTIKNAAVRTAIVRTAVRTAKHSELARVENVRAARTPRQCEIGGFINGVCRLCPQEVLDKQRKYDVNITFTG